MGFGGGEVKVHDSHRARFHKTFCQNVLAGAALVRRQYVVGTKHLFHGCFQTGEGLATRVGVICHMHSSSLTVGHGVHARIGEHIEINIFVLQQEGVITCLLDSAQALIHWQQIQFLNHAYLVHLQWHLVL